jgi:hypothetical protein
MHCTEQQLEHDGIKVSFRTLLAEAIFAGNAMTNYGGASPYNARFGRQPAMLPDLDAPPETTTVGPGRYTHRIREVSLQKIIEATALERIHRASKTTTSATGASLDLAPGEHVYFHRPPAKQDESGWEGPATVVENRPARGQVLVRWNRDEIVVRYADVRKYMDYCSFIYGTFCPSRAVDVIEAHLASMTRGILQTIGFISSVRCSTSRNALGASAWRSARSDASLALATEHFARVILNWPDAYQARLGRGIARFPAAPEAGTYVVLAWASDVTQPAQFESDSNGPCSTSKIFGSEWATFKYLQLLFPIPDDEVRMKYFANPDAQNIDDDARLSTIDEGDEENEEEALFADLDTNLSIFMADCEENNVPLDYLSFERAHERATSSADMSAQRDRHVFDTQVCAGYHYLAVGAEISLLDQVEEFDGEGNGYVEMFFIDDAAKLIVNEKPPQGYCARLRVYVAHNKKAIIDRDTDLLTKEEYQKHA